MKRWFCGFSSVMDSPVDILPQPLDGEMLWQGASPFWVCGSWGKPQIITLFQGSVRLAIVGTCLEPYPTLVEIFQNAIRMHDYSRLMKLPGSYNLIVQDGANTYLFTDVAGLKPVFYTQYGDSIAYSSLALPLQQLIKAEVDPVWLSTFLTNVPISSLLQQRSPFCQIQVVPPGHCLQITNGKPRCQPYWQAPQEYCSFSEAAAQLREQLLTAIEGRVRLYGNVSSDLSGGYDSTSLALLAAKSLAARGQQLNTVTFKTISAIETEDVKWAEHAASLYSNIAAVMVEPDKIPAEYSHLEKIPLTDAPDSSIVNIGSISCLMDIVKSQDSQLHMSGNGGDEVLVVSWVCLADLLRSARIRTFLQHVYGWSRVSRHSPVTIMNSAVKLSLVSYRQWLLQQIKELATGKLLPQSVISQSFKEVCMGWDAVPQVAHWYTKETVDLVIADLQKWARIAQPFANSYGQHEVISLIRYSGICNRVTQQLADTEDVNLEFPFLDSRVIDACLSARPEERTTPFTYKPLLSKALQHDLPSSVFARNTKGDYTADEFSGRKQNLATIQELFQNPLLADMGLIDIKELRAGIEQISMGFDAASWQFNQTLTVELWLRSLQNNYRAFWM